MLRVRNWEKWQSYRNDRGQPPWIKVHRRLMRDINWVNLTDSQRGQLVSIWLLAADNDGMIPSDPKVVQKLCFMSSAPDFAMLRRAGFLDDANLTPERRQDDAPEEKREEESREETETEEDSSKVSLRSPIEPMPDDVAIKIPTNCTGVEIPILKTKAKEWEETYPGVDVPATLREIRQWCIDNPAKRKTAQGINAFVNRWLAKEQNR